MKYLKIIIIPAIAIIIFILFPGTDYKNDSAVPPAVKNDTLLHARIETNEVYKNLVIYYLSGIKSLDNVSYITLSDALEKKYVTLFETGDVNELTISNNSEYYIFINSGDIVKGGKQDRTMSTDIIIPPNEKNVALTSFCVESSRWSQRGDEKIDQFSVNEQMLPSRNLKMAAKKSQNQSMVWTDIALQQSKLSDNISSIKGADIDVRSEESATSLQLTLENPHLDSLRNEFLERFEDIPSTNKSILGFAYAINGELYGADVYNNTRLFQDMWPKLLGSIIVEAITEFESDTIDYENPSHITEKLNEVYEGEKEVKEINSITELITYETEDKIVFETYNKAQNNWIHKSYIVKDTTQAINKYEIDFQRLDYRDNENQMQQRIMPDNIIPQQQVE